MRRTLLLFVLLGGLLCLGLPAQANDETAIHLRGDGTLRRMRVPILMYHYISEPPPGSDGYRINLSLAPDLFEAHLAYMRDENYTSISLYDLDRALTQGTQLPDKPVVLTFDDGYIDQYTTAFPLLTQYGFQGTFFVVTGFADQRQPQYLSWENIGEMTAAGMDMESHTKSHTALQGRTYDYLVYEILGSLQSLDAHDSVAARMFCYPSGRYDADTLAVIRSTNILRAVTTEHGATHTTDNAFELPRLRINDRTGVAGLAQLLRSS